MIDFLGKRSIALTISGILIVISLFLLSTRGFNWGIDFAGGTIMHLKFTQNIDESRVRNILENDLKLQSVVQKVKGEADQVMIRTQMLYDKESDGVTKKKVMSVLTQKLGFDIVEVLSATDIGPIVGAQLRKKAMQALILAVIGILLYIWWRFEFKYGVGATLSLIHDCIITIGVFVLLQREINVTMLAALLTIVGYSINDTIVICDRMRENIRKIKSKSFTEIFNISINQSLSRTINTSVTTFIPVLILFMVTSGTIADFALAMMIGVVVGTYSSIYIVAPVTIYLNEREIEAQKNALTSRKKNAAAV